MKVVHEPVLYVAPVMQKDGSIKDMPFESREEAEIAISLFEDEARAMWEALRQCP